MMKRIVAALFFIGLFVLAVGLLAPGFIDWSEHREKIISRIQPYVGRKITVDGKVTFRILPNPQVSLEGVTVANIAGATTPYLMKLERLEAKVRLKPLLEGRIEVESINLGAPDIHLEVSAVGANWKDILVDKPILGGTGEFRLDQLTVTNGAIHYTNRSSGIEWTLGALDLTLRADALMGPYVASGKFVYRDYPVRFDISTGGYQAGQPVALTAHFLPEEGLPQIKLSGAVDSRDGLDIQADLSISEGKLSSLFDVTFLSSVAFLNENATLNASLDYKARQLKLSNIKAEADGGKASGDITVNFAQGEKPQVTAKLKGDNLTITRDRTFAAPSAFDGEFDLSGKNIVWLDEKLATVSVAAESKDGEWLKTERKSEEVVAPPVEEKKPVKKEKPKKAVVVQEEPKAEEKPKEVLGPAAPAGPQLPPAPEKPEEDTGSTIKGILDRLGSEPEEDPVAEAPAPEVVPEPAPVPEQPLEIKPEEPADPYDGMTKAAPLPEEFGPQMPEQEEAPPQPSVPELVPDAEMLPLEENL